MGFPLSPLCDIRLVGMNGGKLAIPCRPESADAFLSEPTSGVLETLGGCDADILVLGAAGKMGPQLAMMLKRGLDRLGKANRVIAVSRFRSPGIREALESWGVETVAGDLEDETFLASLPAAGWVFFLAGVKFGTSDEPDWLRRINVEVPRKVAARFHASRIVALSTGCVYPFVSVESAGSCEDDPVGPVGDYARSCVGREEAFTDGSNQWGTPTTLVRLNYSVEFRYGVLVDIAQKVRAGEAVDVTMGYVNVIWQREALAYIIRAMEGASHPPWILNVTGPEVLSVRRLADRFAELFERPASFQGTETETAWLSNAQRAYAWFGRPNIGIDTIAPWVAAWLEHGGTTWGKPTHFESRSGQF